MTNSQHFTHVPWPTVNTLHRSIYLQPMFDSESVIHRPPFTLVQWCRPSTSPRPCRNPWFPARWPLHRPWAWSRRTPARPAACQARRSPDITKPITNINNITPHRDVKHTWTDRLSWDDWRHVRTKTNSIDGLSWDVWRVARTWTDSILGCVKRKFSISVG